VGQQWVLLKMVVLVVLEVLIIPVVEEVIE
jgi:hypothetical protein